MILILQTAALLACVSCVDHISSSTRISFRSLRRLSQPKYIRDRVTIAHPEQRVEIEQINHGLLQQNEHDWNADGSQSQC